jgi:hypothetical protein
MYQSTAGLATARIYETTGEKPVKINEVKEASVLVKIKLKPDNNAFGFYLLMLAGVVFCLPDNNYIVPEDSMRILSKFNISYEMTDPHSYEGKRLSENI